jgi:hypothetical protein
MNTWNSRRKKKLLYATLLSIILWLIPGGDLLLWPLRIFTTITHEGGHALMTILTGGLVQSITIYSNGSGLTISEGGLRFLIIPAGYLGEALAGAGCLWMGMRDKSGRYGLMALAIILLFITGLWIRPWYDPLGFGMGLFLAAALFLASQKLSAPMASFLLTFLSVQLCLNSLEDLRTLIFLSSSTDTRTDAVSMALQYGMTPWFWAIIWAILACFILWKALRVYLFQDR